MAAITELIHIGDAPAFPHIETDDAHEAFNFIQAGVAVLLVGPEPLALAQWVLTKLGLTEEEMQDRLRWVA